MTPIPLSSSDVDYASMKKIGTVEICQMASGELLIAVKDFEFNDLPTCRMHVVRAMAWARDLLDAQVKVERLVNSKVGSALG